MLSFKKKGGWLVNFFVWQICELKIHLSDYLCDVGLSKNFVRTYTSNFRQKYSTLCQNIVPSYDVGMYFGVSLFNLSICVSELMTSHGLHGLSMYL